MTTKYLKLELWKKLIPDSKTEEEVFHLAELQTSKQAEQFGGLNLTFHT
jgi:hypothetical protein